ncbi:SPOR domain-containing protein [Thermoflavimicrobium daqui]|uniref:SPOR domain-containing protein n=1 Tax=Thermoflavimicrobium daqui TaxID=2137476 RepID=UPI00143DEE51|nr:SPOR domain-containing protein [Thermoflavimicrobium daqui]
MKLNRMVAFLSFFVLLFISGFQPVANAKESKSLYYVYVGSFKSKENALNRQEALAKKNVNSFIKTVKIKGVTWYRVQVGAFQYHANAKAMVSRMKKAGFHDGFIMHQKIGKIYSVYAGSYIYKSYAIRQQKKLAAKGYLSSIEIAFVKGKKWYRVHLKDYTDPKAAVSFVNKLKRAKINGSFIVAK